MKQKRKLPGSVNRFRRFFEREGVVFSVSESTVPPMKDKSVQVAFNIQSGQTCFFFDSAGEYLGLEWDDMGEWEPKVLGLVKHER
jgi:hypothetical protein